MVSKDSKFSSEELSPFLKFVKNSDEAKHYYNQNATKYDYFYQVAGGVFHIIGVREFVKHLNDVTPLRDVKIADIGAGTGTVGQLLKENGYTNLTAFDISAHMLEEAKMKNIYKDLLSAISMKKMEEYFQQFDYAISIACFGFGLIKPHGLDKITSLVKPGGLVCISFREVTLESEELGFKHNWRWQREESGKRSVVCWINT